MTSHMYKFRLSHNEKKCLEKAVADNASLSSILRIAESGSHPDSLLLEINLETAEHYRDCLTDLLAQIGFDRDYSLTKEGEVIEGLIDKLYIQGNSQRKFK